jgi:hypothetical protein
MPMKKGESRAGTTKKSWNVLYESEVPTVAFVECIEVHDVKLADVNKPGGAGV